MTEDQINAQNCRNTIALELQNTDPLAAIGDHGKRKEILEYRKLLRDYPATSDFPDLIKLPQHPLEPPRNPAMID
jgi:hypothetical protein